MGTINYGTSDVITLGTEPLTSWELQQDPEFMQEIQAEVDEYGGTIQYAIYDYINSCEQNDYVNAVQIVNRYDLNYFPITIKAGYYEGYYIDIDNRAYDFWDEEQRDDALQELEQLKLALTQLAGIGFIRCYPGWITRYDDYTKTITAINQAIEQTRIAIEHQPIEKEVIS